LAASFDGGGGNCFDDVRTGDVIVVDVAMATISRATAVVIVLKCILKPSTAG
jgi:hypothetical protein